MTTPPYAFTGPYANCYNNPDMAMDPRHVFIVHEVLRSWAFWNALELGSFCGASSTAFVEAINAGAKMTATFCEIDPTTSLYEVMRNCQCPEQLRLTREPSWNVLEAADDFDFVLVDANHDVDSVTKELQRLIIRKPLCVMAHDTNATAAGYPLAEGAEMLRLTFARDGAYRCIEDINRRPGERTERGLFLATREYKLFERAVGIFEKWAK